MKRIVLFLLLLMYVTSAEKLYNDYSRAFGIKASNISGYGAYIRQSLPAKFKIQFTGIYYLLQLEEEDKERDYSGYSVGLEVQRDMYQYDNSRLYLTAGGYYFDDEDETKGVSIENIRSKNIGIGVGYEHYFHRVSVAVEAGRKYYFDVGEFWTPEEEWRNFSQKTTNFGVGINIGFIF